MPPPASEELAVSSQVPPEIAISLQRAEDLAKEIRGDACALFPITSLEECRDSQVAFNKFVDDLQQLYIQKLDQHHIVLPPELSRSTWSAREASKLLRFAISSRLGIEQQNDENAKNAAKRPKLRSVTKR